MLLCVVIVVIIVRVRQVVRCGLVGGRTRGPGHEHSLLATSYSHGTLRRHLTRLPLKRAHVVGMHSWVGGGGQGLGSAGHEQSLVLVS